MDRFEELLQLVKHHHISLQSYVETGCRDGGMLPQFEQAGWAVTGIEMDPGLAHYAAITVRAGCVHCGDSAKLIWEICQEIKEPTLFFLDAHWWGGYEECAESDLPLLSELAAIRTRPYADFVVIDDAKLLGLPPDRCKPHKVDAGWTGATRKAVQTALGRRRILRKGVEKRTKPQRMWLSLAEDKDG